MEGTRGDAVTGKPRHRPGRPPGPPPQLPSGGPCFPQALCPGGWPAGGVRGHILFPSVPCPPASPRAGPRSLPTPGCRRVQPEAAQAVFWGRVGGPMTAWPQGWPKREGRPWRGLALTLVPLRLPRRMQGRGPPKPGSPPPLPCGGLPWGCRPLGCWCPKGNEPLGRSSRWLRGSEWREAVEGAVCGLPPTRPPRSPQRGRTGPPSPWAPGQVALPTNRPLRWRGPPGWARRGRARPDTELLPLPPSHHCTEGKLSQPAWVRPCTCGRAGVGQGPLFRYLVILRWSRAAAAGLPPAPHARPPSSLPQTSFPDAPAWAGSLPGRHGGRAGWRGPGERRTVHGAHPQAPAKAQPGPSRMCTSPPLGGPQSAEGRGPAAGASLGRGPRSARLAAPPPGKRAAPYRRPNMCTLHSA